MFPCLNLLITTSLVLVLRRVLLLTVLIGSDTLLLDSWRSRHGYSYAHFCLFHLLFDSFFGQEFFKGHGLQASFFCLINYIPIGVGGRMRVLFELIFFSLFLGITIRELAVLSQRFLALLIIELRLHFLVIVFLVFEVLFTDHVSEWVTASLVSHAI